MPNNYISSWDYANKHIDTTIDKADFVSSSRCIIYAAPYNSATTTAATTPLASTPAGNSPSDSNGDTPKPGSVDFKRIGVVQGWNWGENRQIELIFELGSDIPYLVPGRTTGQISVSRILLFGRDLANMVYQTGGTAAGALPKDNTYIKSLKEINKPFDLLFAAYNNNDASQVYSRVYSGCWIQSKNESVSAGQILIAENVNIMYTNITAVNFPAAITG